KNFLKSIIHSLLLCNNIRLNLSDVIFIFITIILSESKLRLNPLNPRFDARSFYRSNSIDLLDITPIRIEGIGNTIRRQRSDISRLELRYSRSAYWVVRKMRIELLLSSAPIVFRNNKAIRCG